MCICLSVYPSISVYVGDIAGGETYRRWTGSCHHRIPPTQVTLHHVTAHRIINTIISHHSTSYHITKYHIKTIISYHRRPIKLYSTILCFLYSNTILRFFAVLFYSSASYVIPGRRIPLVHIRLPWPLPPDTTYRGKRNTAHTYEVSHANTRTGLMQRDCNFNCLNLILT